MTLVRGVVACALAVAASSAFGQVFGVELVQNGGAEAGAASPDGSQPVPAIPGWTFTGVNVVAYGTPGGMFPTAASPGPVARGAQFFSGGNDNDFANASQSIDVSAGAGDIDDGLVTFSMSGWLGGTGTQNDVAQLAAVFNDGAGQSIGTTTLVGPFAFERGGVTGMQLREATGPLPPGTRAITLVVSMVRTEGVYNNGFADNVSLTLTTTGVPCEPDFNQDGNVDQDDLACLAQVVAGDPSCSDADPDFNGDGNVDQDDISSLAQVVAGAPCP
ncbi:MAG: hypothetical protein SFY69_01675 [Planctomycetota bacterium]|nr:hypothetical protein [Planctomycetota bacterium]